MGIKDSFWAMLGMAPAQSSEDALERVRKAMLKLLDEYTGDDRFQLDAKICYATDIESLWYLRPELMRMIAVTEGESTARVCIAAISDLFQGFVPSSVPSRFSA